MAGLRRAYVVFSCALTGALGLGAAMLLGILALDAEWARALGGRLGEEVRSWWPPRDESLRAASARSVVSRDAPPPEVRAGQDLGPVEARLRDLERSLAAPPPLVGPAGGAGASGPAAGAPGSPWEALREPLHAVANAVLERADPSWVPVPAQLELSTAIERFREGLERVRKRDEGLGKNLPRRLEPRALARLLARAESFSEREAAEVLCALDRGRSEEVIEWLAKLDPDRAARLARRLFFPAGGTE